MLELDFSRRHAPMLDVEDDTDACMDDSLLNAYGELDYADLDVFLDAECGRVH